MPLALRRLLNHLPRASGGSGDIYIRSSWHKPTPFTQWPSQAPFRAAPALRSDHFGRSLRRQRFMRGLLRWSVAFALAWIAIESARGLALL
jgi:hypothetical protein